MLADIRHKLEVLQKDGHAQALSEYRVLRQQDDTWQVILHGASQAVVEVGKAAQELSVADLDLGTNVEDDQPREDLQRAHESLRRTIERLQQGVREAVKEARRDIEAIQGGTEIERWHEALDASDKAFQAASTRLSEEGISDQHQYGSLLEQGVALERTIDGLEGEAERARRLEDDAGKALTEYRQQRDELSDRRQRFVRETSSEIIRVEIDALSNYGNLADTLSETLGIERFEDDRQAITLRIRNEQGGSWDWDRLDAVVAEMRQFLSGELNSWETQDHRFEAALKKVPPERIDRLALYVPEDVVQVSFRDNAASAWRPLTQGSPGQQTAALLAFVLGDGVEPNHFGPARG